jgi:hypothetical protein
VASNFSHGANFATAGPTIRPQYLSLPFPLTLDAQFSIKYPRDTVAKVIDAIKCISPVLTISVLEKEKENLKLFLLNNV